MVLVVVEEELGRMVFVVGDAMQRVRHVVFVNEVRSSSGYCGVSAVIRVASDACGV